MAAGVMTMNTEQLLSSLLQMVQTHVRIPENLQWVPAVLAAFALISGLITIVRGGRSAPGIVAVVFLVVGGAGGYYLAGQIATPAWLTAGIIGLVAGVLGLALFRLWQALLLGGVAMLAAMGVFAAYSLTPEISAWSDGVAPADIAFDLKPAGTIVGEQRASVGQELASLWTHLDMNVPSFQLKVWSVLGSSGLAGLIFGLLLPRASRALWVSALGTLMIGSGVAGLLEQLAPAQLEWLVANPHLGWVAVGIVWVAAFMSCFLTTKPKAKRVAESKPVAKPALA
jgi:hypothetical protein